MAPSGAPPDELLPGTRLADRYVVHERIGGGGMAHVYRGEHEAIRRPVAIKMLTANLTKQSEVVKRFLREARASSLVRHENVMEVTDFGEDINGRPFMVMEYLDGEDLGETLIREGPFNWERTRLLLLQILAALQAAHDNGVIHRDIKPENVFRISQMGSDDFVKVFDFGIAKVLQGDEADSFNALTLEGMVLGTPTHMAPEQCLGEPLDARTDLYAVGVLAFQMLTGRTPFEEELPVKLLYAHVHEPVPPMKQVNPDLDYDIGVEAVVRKALEKKPARRYQSAREFADALLEDIDLNSSSLLPGLKNLFRRWRRRGK